MPSSSVYTHSKTPLTFDNGWFDKELFNIQRNLRNVLPLSGGEISGALNVLGNLSVNTNKFTVNATNGNTLIAGTLGVTGLVSANGGLVVAGGAIADRGGIAVSASAGLVITTLTGSVTDFAVYTPSVGVAISVPTGTINVGFGADVAITGKFGCNGNTPQAKAVSGGTLAGVIAALVATGILSS